MSIPVSVITRDAEKISKPTGNVYKSIAVISKRARQIAANIKEELNNKLSEFATSSDSLEEVFENRLFESQIMKSSLDAENGFTKYPLTAEQSREIQTQLNGLSKRMWNQ